MLVIENGTATQASANTYCSVDYIDTYVTAMGYTGFTASTSTVKEQAVLRAMSYIEALSWKGLKEDYDNPLEWPRAGVSDRNGYALEDNEIPKNMKKAESEITYRELISAKTMQPDLGNDDLSANAGVKRKKIDILETEYFTSAESSGNYKRKYYTIVEGLLQGLLNDDSFIEIGRS